MRKVDEEEKMIRNGNRFITEEKGRGVFPRDVDRLFQQYANLRHKVYNTNKEVFRDEATRQELKSYIDEQFVKLAKEYEINGEVDFPGYIKKALNLRVKHSFIKGRFRDNSREKLGTEENTVEDMLTQDTTSYVDTEERELIDYLLDGASFSNIEMDLLYGLLMGKETERDLIYHLAKKYDMQVKEVKPYLKELREYVVLKLQSDR